MLSFVVSFIFFSEGTDLPTELHLGCGLYADIVTSGALGIVIIV